MDSICKCREGEMWDIDKANTLMLAWAKSEFWCEEEIRRSDFSSQAIGSVEDKLSHTHEGSSRDHDQDASKGSPIRRNPLDSCARRADGQVVTPLRTIVPLGSPLSPCTYAGTNLCGV